MDYGLPAVHGLQETSLALYSLKVSSFCAQFSFTVQLSTSVWLLSTSLTITDLCQQSENVAAQFHVWLFANLRLVWILKARMPGVVAIPFSRSSSIKDSTWGVLYWWIDSLPSKPTGKPITKMFCFYCKRFRCPSGWMDLLSKLSVFRYTPSSLSLYWCCYSL